jgi:hypothetical protein
MFTPPQELKSVTDTLSGRGNDGDEHSFHVVFSPWLRSSEKTPTGAMGFAGSQGNATASGIS